MMWTIISRDRSVISQGARSGIVILDAVLECAGDGFGRTPPAFPWALILTIGSAAQTVIVFNDAESVRAFDGRDLAKLANAVADIAVRFGDVEVDPVVWKEGRPFERMSVVRKLWEHGIQSSGCTNPDGLAPSVFRP